MAEGVLGLLLGWENVSKGRLVKLLLISLFVLLLEKIQTNNLPKMEKIQRNNLAFLEIFQRKKLVGSSSRCRRGEEAGGAVAPPVICISNDK